LNRRCHRLCLPPFSALLAAAKERWQESGVEVKTEAAAGNSVETRASKGHSGKIHGLSNPWIFPLHPYPFSLSSFLSSAFFSTPRKKK